MPAEDKDLIYRLGMHHRIPVLNFEELPFALMRSTAFALPVPATALRVRELEIEECEVIGSHVFFVTRLVTDSPLRAGPQLFHTTGLHQHYRTVMNRPFQPA
jgi:hypothetical protein